ncbi:MAG TPA: hypothetical protein VK756_00315 [Solirubrobacteraceae bacterium]|nr:hypothetical protein [Solirubrobacteraceae bacterium]
MLHRPLRRPLAVVALLSIADYALWNWSLGGNHDVLALVAGLTLVPLLIALAWLLFVGTTRAVAEATRRTRSISLASRRRNAPARRATAARRRGTKRATTPSRAAAESRAARPRAAAHADAGEASPASPSSKLAA